MEEDRNVRVTLVRPSADKGSGEGEIDLLEIFACAKRYFTLWIVLAVVAALLAGSIGLFLQPLAGRGAASALISYANIDPDVSKIKSQSVVEEALFSLGIELTEAQKIIDHVKITGILPQETYDRIKVYQDLIAQKPDIDAANSLLNVDYNYSDYVVSFDYRGAGYSREYGVVLLDALLDAYRKYFNDTYNVNAVMGNPVNVVDYKEYDYAEAIDIFSTSLNSLSDYLSSISADDTAGFRSSQTGYTFSDLSRTVDILRDTDLSRASSFINVNHVTVYDEDAVIPHYEYLIETTARRKAVQETRLEALNDNIATYEKDPIVFAIAEGATLNASSGDVNAYYDSMIQEALSVQRTISSYNRTISYYESVIEGFRQVWAIHPEDKPKAEKRLAALNEKLNRLIEDVNVTSDEFYDKVSYNRYVKVLVPAVAKSQKLVEASTVKLVLYAEAVLFVLYICVAAVGGVKQSLIRSREAGDAAAGV